MENKCLNKENRKGNEHKIRKVKFKSITQQGKIMGNSWQRHKTNNKYFPWTRLKHKACQQDDGCRQGAKHPQGGQSCSINTKKIPSTFLHIGG